MFQKVLSVVTAVSSTITAIFCIWFAANMVHCNNETDKALTESSRSGRTTEAEMAEEREKIERQLNSAIKLPVLPPVKSIPEQVANKLVQDSNTFQDRALKNLEQQRRNDYQGFPGKYDADPRPWERSKR